MSSNQNEKVDELFLKLRSLGDKLKSARAQLGEPLLDRIVSRASKNLARFGDGKGVQPQQPQEPKVVCPRCGKTYLETIAFCSGCGFSFGEERRRQEREQIEGERVERNGRMGVIP